MASTKNVIFIGMTQNGKSSLVQQILRYAGEHEKAGRVGVGRGNFSETQVCSLYDIEVPLKSHHLRQISGTNEEKNGTIVIPGKDFEFHDAEDMNLVEVVEDSGDQIRLVLIDTPGLSDSANSRTSTSGMRTIDERHKLRILLTLQEVEQVHAICFVVKRDTNYGGDFQDLVTRMMGLLEFSVRSNAWNLNYHIIHTNIDVDDRADGTCEVRQRDFDKFGPAGATHHFIDNIPDQAAPMDLFFRNQALSNLFKCLAAASSAKFSNLHYPKTPEHRCNDQAIIDALQHAISKISQDIDSCRQDEISLQSKTTRCRSTADFLQKRIEEYDKKLVEVECDALSEIDGEEGWTDRNLSGGGYRLFRFKTNVPIERVEKSHDGDADWEGEHQTTLDYQIILQAHWLFKAYGSVKLMAKKRDKHKDHIQYLKAQRQPILEKRQELLDKGTEADQQFTRLRSRINSQKKKIEDMRSDLQLVRCDGSVSLRGNEKLVKYFTLDSPLAAALGYQLQTKIPWIVPPLDKLPKKALKGHMSMKLTQAKCEIGECESRYQISLGRLAIANSIKIIMDQISQSPLGSAKVQCSTMLLEELKNVPKDYGIELPSSRMKTLDNVVSQLQSLERCQKAGNKKVDDRLVADRVVAAMNVHDIIEALSTEAVASFKRVQQACWEETATRTAEEYLLSDEGVPTGAFASLARAFKRDVHNPYMVMLSELKQVGELGEIALD
ncbi:hypothetical protein MW887_011522 [Aspergillus wentii]|nr:hypothetical protein MW887_011522 [Aspergillus wentii]